MSAARFFAMFIPYAAASLALMVSAGRWASRQ